MSRDETSGPAEMSDEEWRAEHRRRRAAELGTAEGVDPLDVPRFSPTAWMPRDPAGQRALREMAEDPEVRARTEAELAANRHRDREEIRAMRARNRFNSYRVNRPSMFATATYEDLEPRDRGQAKIRGWWKSGAKNLVVAGLTGRGKTHGSWAVCNEVAAADRDGTLGGMPVTVRGHQIGQIRDLLRPPAVHAARDEVESGRRAREAAELRTCDLLLIDDLTAASVTDWFREEMHKILDARVTADLRTIVTVNATAKATMGKELVDRLGEPIVSRLRDDAVFVWLEGADRRAGNRWDPFADEQER